MQSLHRAQKPGRSRGLLPSQEAAVEPNLPDDILPGTPGLVVRDAEGGRVLQSMVRGFPMRFASMKPGSKPKPVNNIADIGKFPWKTLAQKSPSRCLLRLDHLCRPGRAEECEDEDVLQRRASRSPPGPAFA